MPEPTAHTATIAVTGSTGLVGTQLVQALRGDGKHVLRLVRGNVQNLADEIQWSPREGTIEAARLDATDAVVHLAGANVAGRRWSESYKRQILDSRVQGTTLLCETLAKLEHKPHTLVCASAIGYYGDRGDALLDETSTAGEGFLPEVCLEWERACQPARDAGIRVVNTRIGVVLSPDGGALAKMLTPFKLGVGGVMGSGDQYMSWIALDDLVRGIQFCLEHEELTGAVNLVAPQPATNREFTKTLGRVLHRPTVLPMPAFAARLAFGEMADELLLASTRVAPEALTTAGFGFDHPELEPALRHLLK